MRHHCLFFIAVPAIIFAALCPLTNAQSPVTPASNANIGTTKAAIPDAAALNKASKLVNDVYKDDLLAAKTSDQKLAVAQKMLDATKAEKDSANIFVLLTKAFNLACEAADLQSAVIVVDSLDRAFAIDALKLKVDAATYVAKIITSPEQQRRFIVLIQPLVDSALVADRYDIAKSLSTTLVEIARATKDATLLSAANARLQQVGDAELAFTDAKKAQDALAKNPNDPDANLKLGTYLCFIKGDWEKGLPMLARSSDPTVKALAKTELAGPTTEVDQAKLADGWRTVAENKIGLTKNGLQAHAAQWYKAALPHLTGLIKMEAEKHLAEIAPTQAAGTIPTSILQSKIVDLLSLIDTKREGEGSWTLEQGVLKSGPGDHCKLQLPYHPPAEYDFHIQFSREQGDGAIIMVLTAAGRRFAWVEAGWNNGISAFDIVAGKRGDHTATAFRSKPAIENQRKYDLTIKVRKTGLETYLDGKLISHWKTDFAHMTITPAWRLDDPAALGIGSDSSPVKFYKIEVTEIAGDTQEPAVTDQTSGTSVATTHLSVPNASPATSLSNTRIPIPPAAPRAVANASVPLAASADPNAIERPEFAKTPKPFLKNVTSITAMMVRVSPDGDALGLTSDIIASVPTDARNSRDGGANFSRSKVGDEMQTSFQEAIRAVRLRYPIWQGRIDFSFGEKYSEHDGGSAGTAFGLLMLSTLEGIDLDPKCAVTGDITVDWKVRKVGGVTAKLHGATLDKCLYAAIPADNETAFADMALLYGDRALWDIQVFSIATLQEAEAIARKDRPAQLAEAIKLFASLQPELAKSEKLTLKDPATQMTLQHILELAPNHLSAKYLLAIAHDTAAKTLSANATLYRLEMILYPYRVLLKGRDKLSRATLPVSVTVNARKQLAVLRPIADKDIRPLLSDESAFIESMDEFAANPGRASMDTFVKRAGALDARFDEIANDKDLRGKLMREGY